MPGIVFGGHLADDGLFSFGWDAKQSSWPLFRSVGVLILAS